jgi:hypothetical protein
LHRRTYDFPTPRTAIVFDGQVYKKLSPDAELATPEQIAEREKELDREHAQREAIYRPRVAKAAEEPAVISVCGFRVRASDGVIVQP